MRNSVVMKKLLILSIFLACGFRLYAGTDAAMAKYDSGNGNQVQIPLATISKDINGVAVGSITTVYTPTSGKKYRLVGGTISVSAAGSVLFEDNSVNNFVYRTPKLAADTPYTFVVLQGQGKLSAAANNVLKATLSTSGNVTGTLDFSEE